MLQQGRLARNPAIGVILAQYFWLTAPVLAFGLCSVVGLEQASAHISLRSPAPRVSSQKVAPCGSGSSTRGDKVATYRPGETITVEWDETVDHPGHYRIAFDLDGNDDFPLPNSPNDDFTTTLVDQIPDRQGAGAYTQEITFPNQECDNCTLQLIQIMTVNVPYNSFYFQCADIRLSNDAPAGPDAGPDTSGGDGGGGCAMSSSQSGSSAVMMLFGLLLLRRRSKRRGFAARRAPVL